MSVHVALLPASRPLADTDEVAPHGNLRVLIAGRVHCLPVRYVANRTSPCMYAHLAHVWMAPFAYPVWAVSTFIRRRRTQVVHVARPFIGKAPCELWHVWSASLCSTRVSTQVSDAFLCPRKLLRHSCRCRPNLEAPLCCDFIRCGGEDDRMRVHDKQLQLPTIHVHPDGKSIEYV